MTPSSKKNKGRSLQKYVRDKILEEYPTLEENDVKSTFEPRCIKQFKTLIDENGRECTKCGLYKKWDEFRGCSKSYTKKQSSCKACCKEKRSASPRTKEIYNAKTHLKNLKKKDPIEYKARLIRSSLLNRERENLHMNGTTPTKQDIKVWLEEQIPFVCYYSGVSLSLSDKFHIDHKIPVNKGGTNELANLCICSRQMNTAKGGLTEKEFKELLHLISTWEDKGDSLLRRLRQGFYGG